MWIILMVFLLLRLLLGQEGQKKHDFLYWEFDEPIEIGVRMETGRW